MWLLMLPVLFWGQQAAGAPVFDAASVKPAAPASGGAIRLKFEVGRDRFTEENESLGFLIQWAYDVAEYQFPAWAATPSNPKELDDRYVITASAGNAVSADVMHQMVQQLLAQRFQLKVHWETKSAEGYKLVLLPGAKFSKLDQEPPPTLQSSSPFMSGQTCTEYIAVHGNTFRSLAQRLTTSVTRGKPVVDQTGLEGTYNIDLSFMRDGCVPTNPDWEPATAPPANGPIPLGWHLVSSPSLDRALKAMGLALVPATVEVRYLMLDNVGSLIPD